MNSIKGRHFVSFSGVYKQHPAPRLETECQTGTTSRVEITRHDPLDKGDSEIEI